MKPRWFRQKVRNEQGQSLIIIAFSIFVLMGFVGLAIDVGISYVDRVRARRAADAAALAAASELPLEAAAQVRALEYLETNGYPCGLTVSYENGGLSYTCTDPETRIEINTGYPGSYANDVDPTDAQRTIVINTAPYRSDAYAADTAARIEVIVRQKSPVFFMRIFGFNDLPIEGRAVGENINNLDVVLVYDNSGSMEFDTLCYGCWTPQSGMAYPDGARWRLPWNGPADGPPAHCSGGPPLVAGGKSYIIIEAEEYDSSSVPYNRDAYVQGMTYWVIQRNGSQAPYWQRYDNGAEALGRDPYGAYISHFPYYNHSNSTGSGVTCTWDNLVNNGGVCLQDTWVLSNGGPFPNPHVDYTVRTPSSPSSATWYIWVRGQGGSLIWGINGTPWDQEDGFDGSGNRYNGADRDYWEWRKLDRSVGPLSGNSTFVLNIWAATSGFDIDRIIVTNDSRNPYDVGSSIRNNTAYIDNNRNGQACEPCDARFGGYPGGPGGGDPPNCVISGFPPSAPQNYRYNDWIYDDEQPIRGAVEAAKRFVQRLDPQYDQIGLVSYSTTARIRDELQCVRRLGATNCNETVFNNTVISSLDAIHAGGSTNIGHATKLGIDVLSNTSGHYGRPGAAHIMILLTDGEANQTDNLPSECYAQDYWPHNQGNPSSETNRAKDCVVYYARQARNNGIVIYSITLGVTADIELMEYIAELTGGVHRNAPRPEQLDPIFDELYNRIFLRLVE